MIDLIKNNFGWVCISVAICVYGISGCTSHMATMRDKDMERKTELTKWCIDNGYRVKESWGRTQIYKIEGDKHGKKGEE